MCDKELGKIVLHTELRSSKNSRQFVRLKTGRTVLLKSKYAAQQDKLFASELEKNYFKWAQMTKNVKSFPLKVGFYVYRATHRRWDWMNILQGLADAMVRAGYLEDDSAKFFTPVFLGFDVDKDDPRVEISIVS